MPRLLLRYCTLFLLSLSLLFPLTASASTPGKTGQQHNLIDFPAVDPGYIYNQLFYMATNFQHREAGYDNNLPVTVNGHDEFADYWSQEMLKDLAGFGPVSIKDSFPIKGWTGRPAKVPAFNVEVSVPGVTHPEQVVVIGCHYDGEAISTQSANDDASGCAIELGVAKAMGDYWRTHHAYPARTLRFVIFDAEEQGLYGSFHYLNSTINGDVQNIVAMFNEEQNGIAYPLRFLGKLSNPILPFYIDMSPLQNNSIYPNQSNLSQAQIAAIVHFRALMQQAVPAVFAQFQALGFTSITYHGDNNKDVVQPVFTSDQQSNIQQEDDNLGGSDQIPFTLAGLPCATFVGNSSYYDANPPPWSYPFDQREDTIQLMNTYANGSSQEARALDLALALPGMLTTWMLHQPDILGQATADANPIATISDIGQTQVGQALTINAQGAFDVAGSNTFSYNWDFGDGATATGIAVSHTYSGTGKYTLSLIVSSGQGKRTISKVLQVVQQTTTYENPYANYHPDGNPPSNPAVQIPVPNDTPTATVTTTATQGGDVALTPTTPSGNPGGSSLNFWLIGVGIVLVFIVLLGLVIAIIAGRKK